MINIETDRNHKLNVEEYLNNTQKVINQVNQEEIIKLVNEILKVYENSGAIYVFGNGGSGANASHFCGDVLKGISYGLDKRFKAICLNDNNASMMAIANDISYNHIFEEQVKNFVTNKDLVIGISGSGNSKNVLYGVEAAKIKGAKTFALCGYDGGKLKLLVDNYVHININDMEIVEDLHSMVFHCVKRVIMENLKEKYNYD
ncbi:SIS domain-containing protein [archaeon]|jgi:D-sedoheptulose 7-phosphate isomerase|nr:SIS domain-containing protein [archaeon]MBT3451361.1 SIS domain-containing protein [archaeon]MBT6869323.1 SIS domain-containing protein [archaeon]MBT7192486.1 SIS domain-containing protein [archaeon]MBT7380562.1 SIS domain-containing protein [archaeon]